MRVLVVGCGSIGSRHARNLSRLKAVDLDLHDTDRGAAEDLAEATGATVVSGPAPASEEWDAAVVAVPTHKHVDVARPLAEAGLDLLVEKPLANDPAEARAFVDDAARLDATALVGCNMRFHPGVRALRDWIEDDAIGRPLSARLSFGNHLGNWRDEGDYQDSYSADPDKGGGIVMDAVHEINAMRWLLGEPAGVTAHTVNTGALGIPAEDLAELVFDYGGGTLASVHMDSIRPSRRRTHEVVGEAGIARWSGHGKRPERLTIELEDRDGGIRERREEDFDMNAMYEREIRHFLDVVRHGEAPLVDATSGLRDVVAAYRAREASRTGERHPLPGEAPS